MNPKTVPTVRDARHDDEPAICEFGKVQIPLHYESLIGAVAASNQVKNWWNEAQIRQSIQAGKIVVAEDEGCIVGVAEGGFDGAKQVIYKLYIHRNYRGRGLGPKLLGALINKLPGGTSGVYIEHFAANERAGAFYEREGFHIDRIEPSNSGSSALDVVWRYRSLN